MSISLRHARYYKTFVDSGEMPPSEAEVAFVGRSNVGKSSVINALCGQKNLAITSQTPGRTRAINVFLISKTQWLIDLPGYGYAVGARREKEGWQKMIEPYLLERSSLKKIFLLIDAYVGPTALDRQMVEWLKANDRPYAIICNKTDKIKSSKREHRRRQLASELQVSLNDLFWVSALKYDGFPVLSARVREWLGES